jgi:hypothetical protein
MQLIAVFSRSEAEHQRYVIQQPSPVKEKTTSYLRLLALEALKSQADFTHDHIHLYTKLGRFFALRSWNDGRMERIGTMYGTVLRKMGDRWTVEVQLEVNGIRTVLHR